MDFKIPKYCDTTKVIDRFITKSKFIVPAFLILIFLVFEATFTIWNILAEYLDIFFNYLYWLTWIENTFINSVFWWIIWVLIFIPNIFILYFFLYFLNDSWILPRISYVFDKYLKKIGLSWSSFLTLFLWLWCTIPALMSTSHIKWKKEKILAAMMLPFVSCSAKIPVYVLFTAIFIPAQLQSITLILIYLIGIILGIISNIVLSKILKYKKDKFSINLPRYRLPNITEMSKKITETIWHFIKKIAIYIIPFSILLTWAFSYPTENKLENTYWAKAGEYINVVFEPIWFNETMSIAAISWFIWKEITVSTIWALYYIKEEDENWLIDKIKNDKSIDYISAISFILFILLYTPCIWATITATKILGKFWWFMFIVYPLIFAWIVSFVTYNSLSFFFK